MRQLTEYEVYEGEDNLHARIVAVLDANGEPTTLPGTPSWGSTNLNIAAPIQSSDGMSARIAVGRVGECDIYVDTGVSDTPTTLVQGRCHLTVKPKPNPGEVRTVIIELSTT